MILVTGGAGFIGSNFVLNWFKDNEEPVINLDKLTYAGNPANLASLQKVDHYHFVHGDITDQQLVAELLAKYQPRAIVHFAAETHVDRSIRDPDQFIKTNVTGTYTLLNETLRYWETLPANQRDAFRFLHVSTDEVFGALELNDTPFDEKSPYNPSSPYSASKAASDHLVNAYNRTYGLPTVVSHCTNNYGPYQFPEKLLPLMIVNAKEGKRLPLYGDGLHERNWLYVEDHCRALGLILSGGTPGERYVVGSEQSRSNRDVVEKVCVVLDELLPASACCPHASLIEAVGDRPGHDRRYDVCSDKVTTELGWEPQVSFDEGIRQTVQWYLDNEAWVQGVVSGEYRNWVAEHYQGRLD